MKKISVVDDSAISAKNVMVEMTIGHYVDLVEDALGSNEFQRKRVNSSKTIYSLLKSDLKSGCVIPPIVLALMIEPPGDFLSSDTRFSDFILSNRVNIRILDGLQRTYTMRDLLRECASEGPEVLDKVRSHFIRVELYVGINRLGVLYRMLTLNTGQTPMSLRHQIEILYSDLIDCEVEGIELIREADGKKVNSVNKYAFKDVIDGFNAYLERNELPLDKADILENIKGLEKLASESRMDDVFREYLVAWRDFMQVVCISNGHAKVEGGGDEDGLWVFGSDLIEVFKRSQALTGFGAAVGVLKDFKVVNGFDDIKDFIGKLPEFDAEHLLGEMNQHMEWIRNNIKKIGNAQRAYFKSFFRELFNSGAASFLNVGASVEAAFVSVKMQFMGQ